MIFKPYGIDGKFHLSTLEMSLEISRECPSLALVRKFRKKKKCPVETWPGPLVIFCHLLPANSYNLIFERMRLATYITLQNFSAPAAGCLYYPLKFSVSAGSYFYYPLKIFRRLRRATFITPSKLFDACDGLLISSLKNFWRLRWATYITIQKFLAPAAGYL